MVEKLKYIDLHKLCFSATLVGGEGSAYGVIWNGLYDKKPCVIKMLSLNTGIHYDKDANEHYTKQNKKLTINQAHRAYSVEHCIPFIHKKFFNKRSISIDKFLYEINQFLLLGKHSLAPYVYDYGISHTIDGFKYGFIVMEKVHSNIKLVRQKRHLHLCEKDIIKNKINELHTLGFSHGDLKPNNIGCYLSDDGMITRCVFFDCYTVKVLSEKTPQEAEKLINKDWSTYTHYYSKLI